MARCTPIGSKSMRHPAARHVDLRLAVAVGWWRSRFACGRSDPPRLGVTPLPANGTTNSGDLRYQLRNVGGRTLALDGLASTCGCAAIMQLPETLAPGAASVLAVQCGLCAPSGRSSASCGCASSDPSNPETVLRITQPGGDAGPDPAALYFGYVAVGESAVRDVVLPVAVSAASVTLPAQSELRVEPMPARADGAHGVRVVFTPGVAGVVRATVDLGPAAVCCGHCHRLRRRPRVPRRGSADPFGRSAQHHPHRTRRRATRNHRHRLSAGTCRRASHRRSRTTVPPGAARPRDCRCGGRGGDSPAARGWRSDPHHSGRRDGDRRPSAHGVTVIGISAPAAARLRRRRCRRQCRRHERRRRHRRTKRRQHALGEEARRLAHVAAEELHHEHGAAESDVGLDLGDALLGGAGDAERAAGPMWPP